MFKENLKKDKIIQNIIKELNITQKVDIYKLFLGTALKLSGFEFDDNDKSSPDWNKESLYKKILAKLNENDQKKAKLIIQIIESL